jgi:hypothetical protein
MVISIEDGAGMDADKYGNGITLTNGITVTAENSGVIMNLTDPIHPILKNGHWAHYCFDADVKSWGSGNEHLVARWTFEKFGKPLILRGSHEEYLAVNLHDTFTALVEHHFLVQGYVINTT